VVGAAFEAGADARTLTGSAFVSMLIFWVAHVCGSSWPSRRRGVTIHPRVIRVVACREWPLVELQISGWGFVAGLRSGGSPLSAVTLGAGQGVLGVALLALEGVVE
jgi:hypothetical protein